MCVDYRDNYYDVSEWSDGSDGYHVNAYDIKIDAACHFFFISFWCTSLFSLPKMVVNSIQNNHPTNTTQVIRGEDYEYRCVSYFFVRIFTLIIKIILSCICWFFKPWSRMYKNPKLIITISADLLALKGTRPSSNMMTIKLEMYSYSFHMTATICVSLLTKLTSFKMAHEILQNLAALLVLIYPEGLLWGTAV